MSTEKKFAVVTGAFSYTGRFIAERLLAKGWQVATLTRRQEQNSPLANRIISFPFNFDKPTELANNLKGTAVLFNTYWVRFNRGNVTFDKAVENTKTLIRAAKAAGIKRIVHIGVSNPSLNSPLGYFRGKAQIEEAIQASGLSYALIRPALMFGYEDILINNIAWALRRFHVFPVFGDGKYKVQPIYIEDLADLAVKAAESNENFVMDAVGPEIYSFNELVDLIGRECHVRSYPLHLPPSLAYFGTTTVGYLVGDVVLTWEEVQALMAGLLVSSGPPTAATRLTNWLKDHADELGRVYRSELSRNFR